VEQRKTAGNLQAYCKVPTVFVVLVPADDIFSNSFFEDLDKLWLLREWIPDPCDPLHQNLTASLIPAVG
jgi:hypothetical protein